MSSMGKSPRVAEEMRGARSAEVGVDDVTGATPAAAAFIDALIILTSISPRVDLFLPDFI